MLLQKIKWTSSTTNLIKKKGQKAIRKLKHLSKEKPKVVKQWLSKQAFWQVHLPPPKHVNRSHYEVMIPNEMHQFDLLYMPSDTLHGNKYKYILSGIKVTSRYKVARPLRTTQAKDVADMIADIYKVGPLKELCHVPDWLDKQKGR